MATPTQPRGGGGTGSTPKPHLPNTPSRMLASPRPGTAGKTTGLAQRSPAAAMKTPASNHLPGLSVSSQPSSTPLGVVANIHEELLRLDSPAAALINSIARDNQTPMGGMGGGIGGQPDGLGLGLGNMSGNTPLPLGGVTRDLAGGAPRDPAMERIHNLQLALDKLKPMIMGRSVTRDGIKRAAQVHGLEAADLDDDNLVVAGENIVEMEITFDAVHKDTVRDLQLKLNYDGEAHTQREATEMLKHQVSEAASYEDLQDFVRNVEYLAQLEKIESKPNAFQLVGDLSGCLRRIWDEEKKKMHWRDELHHMRKGAMGRPRMDHGRKLGLRATYWKKESDEVKDDAPIEEGVWHANVSCEAGMPMMMAPKDWLKQDVLTEGQPGQNVLDAKDHVFHPSWLDTSTGLAIKTDEPKDEGSMDVDKKTAELPQQLNVHFICCLEPEVLVPVSVVAKLNSEIQMVDTDPQKAVTYHQTLQRRHNAAAAAPAESVIDDRWKRRLFYVDPEDNLTWHNQSYKLYSPNQDSDLWCYPLSKIRFNHPRQLTDLLPVLRMHIKIWTLLDSIVKDPPSKQPAPPKKRQPGEIRRRSNRPAATEADDSLNIDITLDYMSNPTRTSLSIIAPFRATTGPPKKRPSTLYLTVQVGLNGVIEVTDISGVASFESDIARWKTKLAKMLTLVEDIGLLVQWLQMRGQS